MGGRFTKFRRSIGKFQVDFSKNKHQQNFEEDFLGKPCSYFLNVFGFITEPKAIFFKKKKSFKLILVAMRMLFRGNLRKISQQIGVNLDKNAILG